MTRSAIRLFVVALALALGACANTPSTSTSSDAAGKTGSPPTAASKPTGLLIEPVDALKLGYSIDWVTHLNLGKGRTLIATQVLGDLLVTADRPSNVVTAISMRDGKQLWRQQAGHAPYHAHAPARVDDRILVNTETQIFEFDASAEGKLINRADLASAVGTAPAMIGDVAVFGGSDGMIFGHDTRTGYARWRYKMPGQILVPPQASGQQVFVVVPMVSMPCSQGPAVRFFGAARCLTESAPPRRSTPLAFMSPAKTTRSTPLTAPLVKTAGFSGTPMI